MKSGGFGRLRKRSITVIVKQPVLAVARYIHVSKAVVVIISHCRPNAVHLHIQARSLRDIREFPVAVIAVQLHRVAFALVPRPVHAVDQ